MLYFDNIVKALEFVKQDHIENFGAETERLSIKFYDTLIDNMKELEQYRSIGTPGECRAAVEKQRAVAPHKIVLFNGKKGYKCANCGNNLEWSVLGRPYCGWCGQVIQWERDSE